MKKFLAFMCVLLVIVSMGLLTVYLLKDDESLTLQESATYYNVEENVSVNFKIDHKKQSSKLIVTSSNPEIVSVDSKNNLKALNGGEVYITAVLKNAAGKVKGKVDKLIRVGDGSTQNPFYIRTGEELLSIGRENSKFSLNNHYVQTENISLAQNWTTIPGVFTGSYVGVYKTNEDKTDTEHRVYIKGMKVSGINATSAMFETIAPGAKVGYLRFIEVDINGNFDKASVVASENNGEIDFISVSGSLVNNNTSGINGGIVAKNMYSSSFNTETNLDNIITPSISRCTNSLAITIANGTIGGIAGINNAKVYACINGGVNDTDGLLTYTMASTTAKAGGLVGENEFNSAWSYTKYVDFKPIIADSYSNGKIVVAKDPDSVNEYTGFNSSFVGGIIGKNTNASNEESKLNLVFGNYYVVVGKLADEISPAKLYNRGIGNGYIPGSNNAYSTLEVEAGDPSNIAYYACGVNAADLIGKGGLISFKTALQEEHWSKQVWVFYENNFPILVDPIDFSFSKLPLTLPVINVPGGKITTPEELSSADFKDKDYSGQSSFMVMNDLDCKDLTSFVSKTNVVANLTGALINENGTTRYPVIKNLTVNLQNPDDVNNFGLFSSASNMRVSNLTFENLQIVFNESNNALNAGLLFGSARNCKVENVSFTYTGESLIQYPAVENFGTVAGVASNTSISNVTISDAAYVGTPDSGSYNGVLVGSLINNSQVNACSVLRVEISASADGAYVAGIAGQVDRSSISNCIVISGPNGKLDGKLVAGIAGIVSGTISKCNTDVVLIGQTQTAGFAITLESNATITDCKTKTRFLSGTGTNVGFISTMKDGSRAQNIILENSFEAGSLNFSKTSNKPKQMFSGWDASRDGKRNYDNDTNADLINCFYNNKYSDGVSQATNFLIMIKDNGLFGLFSDDWRFGGVPDIDYGGRFNGPYGTGRIDDNGSLVTNKNKKSYTSFGFSENFWDLSGIPTLRLSILK